MKINLIIGLFSLWLFAACKKESTVNLTTEIHQIENSLIPAIQVKDSPNTFYNIEDRMEYHKVPGISIAVVKDGKIRWAKAYGMANTEIGTKVDTNTLFQAGSISKPLAALAALDLVEKGKLNLDEDVNEYLRGWQIPTNRFTEDNKVTLRKLLTHTAGMTVHGFPGYTQSDTFPSIIEVLNGEGNTPGIYVDTFPGAIWRYSGGGYTVMEKAVEDVSGRTLDEYMDEFILKPMGMVNSTYQQPIGKKYREKVSAAYDSEGKILEGWWNNYPEQAAAGLWTTPLDLARYCIEIYEIFTKKDSGILSNEIITEMLTKDKNNWGLGPSLKWEGDSLIFRHGGKNAGFTNEFFCFAKKGDGAIIMTSADNGGRLIGEILKSLSKYYEWGTNNPRIVETIELPQVEIQKFVGRYKLDFQVPEIGDYIIDLSIRDNQLFVEDSNNGDTNVLVPIEEKKFIDLEKGDEIVFQINDGLHGLLWNNRFQFYKIED